MRRVDFYFDYLSGYAYFAWIQLRPLCAKRKVELAAHPTLFAGLLNHWGQLGPAEIPPKRRWAYSDGYRIAKLHGLEFSCPKFHPFNPLPALRLSLPEVGGERQHEVIDALFRAGWGRGIDLGSPEELSAALNAAGLPGPELIEKTNLPEVKAALKKSTDDAIAAGVFGVPSMIVGEELFWGSDRMDHVALALDGEDPLDRAFVDSVLARPKMADRRDANAKKA
jgi:2-hydroxychromene-2-carboxylate isomerase